VLRPALNGLGSRSIRAQGPSTLGQLSRPLSIQASRPRRNSPTVPVSRRYASSDSQAEQLGKTGLYELHASHGAKFVPFGGYSMPVQYSDLSIIESHHWTREKASLFDVGHM
jgi:aminomethyltransferase